MAKDNRPVLSEELAYSPTGGRTKMWAFGVGLELVPLAYGLRCLLTGRARFFSLRVGSSFDVSGAAATSLGIAYLAVALFIHAHWFWGLHPRLEPFSGLLKGLALVAFLGGFGFAVFKVFS